MYTTDTIFIDKVHITVPKLQVKFQPDPLKILSAKVEISAKVEKVLKNAFKYAMHNYAH